LTIDDCCNEAEIQTYRRITVEKQENTCEDEGKKACISTASGWLLFEEREKINEELLKRFD
jgi:hypothetical protein